MMHFQQISMLGCECIRNNFKCFKGITSQSILTQESVYYLTRFFHIPIQINRLAIDMLRAQHEKFSLAIIQLLTVVHSTCVQFVLFCLCISFVKIFFGLVEFAHIGFRHMPLEPK